MDGDNEEHSSSSPSSSSSESDPDSDDIFELDYDSATSEPDSHSDKSDSDSPQSFTIENFREGILELADKRRDLLGNGKEIDLVIDSDNPSQIEEYMMMLPRPVKQVLAPAQVASPCQAAESRPSDSPLPQAESSEEAQQRYIEISDANILQLIREVQGAATTINFEDLGALDSTHAPTFEELMEDPSIISSADISISLEESDLMLISASIMDSPLSDTWDNFYKLESDTNVMGPFGDTGNKPMLSAAAAPSAVAITTASASPDLSNPFSLHIPSSPSSIVSNLSTRSFVTECIKSLDSSVTNPHAFLLSLENGNTDNSENLHVDDPVCIGIDLSDKDSSDQIEFVDLENDEEIEIGDLENNESIEVIDQDNCADNEKGCDANGRISDNFPVPEIHTENFHSEPGTSDTSKQRKRHSPSSKSSCIPVLLKRVSLGMGFKKLDDVDKYVRNKRRSKLGASKSRTSVPKVQSAKTSNSDMAAYIASIPTSENEPSAQCNPKQNEINAVETPGPYQYDLRIRSQSVHTFARYSEYEINLQTNRLAKTKESAGVNKNKDKTSKTSKTSKRSKSKVSSRQRKPSPYHDPSLCLEPRPPLLLNEKELYNEEDTSVEGYYIRNYDDCVPTPDVPLPKNIPEDGEDDELVPYPLSTLKLPRNSAKKKNAFFLNIRCENSVEVGRRFYLSGYLSKPPKFIERIPVRPSPLRPLGVDEVIVPEPVAHPNPPSLYVHSPPLFRLVTELDFINQKSLDFKFDSNSSGLDNSVSTSSSSLPQTSRSSV